VCFVRRFKTLRHLFLFDGNAVKLIGRLKNGRYVIGQLPFPPYETTHPLSGVWGLLQDSHQSRLDRSDASFGRGVGEAAVLHMPP
jgi:hypothetical protein